LIPDARIRHRYVLVLMVLVAAVAAVVAFSAISFLQGAVMNEQRARLVEQARSQARLFEEIVRDEVADGRSVPAAADMALLQVNDALSQYQPASAMGDVQIARQEGDKIVFLVRQRRGDGGLPDPLTLGGPLALPMQRALLGQSGTMIGVDYRGVTVVAAYEPVAVLGYGVVAKVDLVEIRAPFRRAAWLALGPTCGAILLGGGLLLVLNRPLLRRAREAERRYEELVQTLGQGLSILDGEGRLTYVNDRLCEMLGYRRDELLGRPVKDVFAPESRDRLVQELARRRDGESSAYEVVMVGRGGEHRHALISARPVRRPDGGFIGSVGVITDVTELRHAADELRREKELSQGYFDVVGVMLVVLDSQGRIELINRRGVDALGYRDAGELVGREWFEVCIPEEVRDEVRRVFTQIIAGDLRPAERYENAVVTRDGRRRRILWHSALLRDPEGRVCGTLSSGEDVTERRRDELALSRRAMQLQIVNDVSQRLSSILDLDELLLHVVRAVQEGFGFYHADVFLIEERREYAVFRVGSDPAGTAASRELGLRCRVGVDGMVGWVAATGEPLLAGDVSKEPRFLPDKLVPETQSELVLPISHEGRILGVLDLQSEELNAFAPDDLSVMTTLCGQLGVAIENARLHEAVQTSEERYRLLLQHANDAVYVHAATSDAPGRFLDVNDKACEMLGYTREEFLAMDMRAIMVPEQVERDPVIRRRLFEEGHAVFETEDLAKDGRRIPVEVSVRLFDLHGVPTALSVTRDITERRKMENTKLELEARLRQNQRLESIGTLASGVAHEINNPLTGIINYAQLIVDRTDSDSLREFARGIVDEGNRVAEIVKNLLSFSRQSREGHSPARVTDIVTTSLSLIRASLRQDGIHIDVEVPGDLPSIMCRSQQIQQILLNLLTNARDGLNARYPGYDKDKVVRVSAERVDRDGRTWIRLAVEDHGAGIPPTIVGRVFDPFFTTKPRDQGTGLGLSISYGIVRDHHGTLTVESVPNQSTRFLVELPVDDGWDLSAPARGADGGRRA
jgi:PAS domain S-box-containing protein